jgi:hypothetical protein
MQFRVLHHKLSKRLLCAEYCTRSPRIQSSNGTYDINRNTHKQVHVLGTAIDCHTEPGKTGMLALALCGGRVLMFLIPYHCFSTTSAFLLIVC